MNSCFSDLRNSLNYEIAKQFFTSPLEDLKTTFFSDKTEFFEGVKGNGLCHTIVAQKIAATALIGGFGLFGLAAAMQQEVSKKSDWDKVSLLGAAIVCFGALWALWIRDKSVARGINNFKSKIEKSSLAVVNKGTALIFEPFSDHNGAFHLSYSEVANYQSLNNRFKISTQMLSLTKEGLETIHRLADEGHDIQILMLNAHGTDERLEWSELDSKKPRFDYFTPNNLYGYEIGLEAALERLNPNAVIILNSCNGAGASHAQVTPSSNWQTKNIAHRIAALANKRLVIAGKDFVRTVRI